MGKNIRAFVPSANDDTHFTVLGFTSFSGKPVIAVIIMKKKTPMTHAEMFGVNHCIRWTGKEDDVHSNTGPGLRYPGGPYCFFNNTAVPAYVTQSESGGIRAEILVDVLTTIDLLKLIPQSDNLPDPFLLLDGHGSRLHPSFVDYVLTDEHEWNVTFGLPHGTGYW